MKPLIITCAITGAETSKKNQPNLPISPDEQAVAAKEAIEAGASIIHLHVRDENGNPSQSTERFKQAIDKIRNLSPHAIIQISTGGAVGESIENRVKPLSLKPEMASLNLGTLNFGDDVFLNHPKDITALAEKMKSLGVVPELEIYEAGMLEAAVKLRDKGLLPGLLHFQFVLGVPGGMSGEIENLLHLINLTRKYFKEEEYSWAVAGVGRFQIPLAYHSILLNGNVRVGFEDNIYFRKGELAKSNAQMVERVVKFAKEVDRPVATVVQAREILGLTLKK